MDKTTKILLVVFVFVLLVVGLEIGFYFYSKSRPVNQPVPGKTETSGEIETLREFTHDEIVEAEDLVGKKISGKLEEIRPGGILRITTDKGEEMIIELELNFVEPKGYDPEVEDDEAEVMTDEIVRLGDLVGRDDLEFDFRDEASFIYY